MTLTLQEKLMLCLSQPVVCCGDDDECLCTLNINQPALLPQNEDEPNYLSYEI